MIDALNRHKVLFAAFLLMLPVMFVLPFFSADNYSLVRHTTSQLGAQNAPYAWIMNAVFVLLGLGTTISAWRNLKRYPFQLILLVAFSVSIALTGIYSHAPIIEGLEYNKFHDSLHSLFATTTGISFTIFAFSFAFIASARKHKILAIVVGLSASILSLLMFSFDDYAGI